MKKVLITGGCGFLGQFLVKELKEEFSEVEIKLLDLREHPRPFLKHDNVEVLVGKDITDYESIKDEFKGCDVVIHLAGIVSFSLRDKVLLKKVNVDGTVNVARAVMENKDCKMIHISSVAALGYENYEDFFVDEEFVFNWNIAKKKKKYYMLTKHMADVKINKARKNGLNAIVLYPGLLFGPGDYTNSAKLVKAIWAGRIPFNMPGGTNLIDVRDVAKGIVKAIKKGKTGEDYLLSGHNMLFTDINQIIAEGVNAEAPKRTLPRMLNGALFHGVMLAEKLSKKKLELTADNVDSAFKYRYFSNEKALKELDWKPEIDFEETVADTVDWMVHDGQFEE